VALLVILMVAMLVALLLLLLPLLLRLATAAYASELLLDRSVNVRTKR